MNPQPELQSDTLRSDIDNTRERMDETIDAIGNRLEGRHLVDELIGFFRGRASNGQAGQLGERFSHTAGVAVRSVTDTVKAHPIPTILAGAGVAWLIYETRRRRQSSMDDDLDYSGYSDFGESTTGYLGGDYSETDQLGTTVGTEQDFGGEESFAAEDQFGAEQKSGVAAKAKEKLSNVAHQAKEKASALTQRSREAMGTAKERLNHLTGDVRERGRQAYSRTRERVVTTSEQHPLEVGLGCLAAGVIIGLLLPTPEAVTRRVSPTANRLRDRAREAGSEIAEKGKRVVQAAVGAAKVEAKTQGLTVSRLREQAAAVGEHAREAATDTARQEGLVSGESGKSSTDPARPADPSAARPTM